MLMTLLSLCYYSCFYGWSVFFGLISLYDAKGNKLHNPEAGYTPHVFW